MTTEKSYLMGKFARVAVNTGMIDYNGRLCMVSAAYAHNMAFGVDRAANPWSDIALADVIFSAGTNTSECHPLTMPYIWEARDRGGKHIVVDPRVTPQRAYRRCPPADKAWHQLHAHTDDHQREETDRERVVVTGDKCVRYGLSSYEIAQRIGEVGFPSF